MIIAVAIVSVLAVFWNIRHNNRSDELDEREKELDELSLSLNERRNEVAACELQAERWYYSIKEEKDKIDNAKTHTASYVVTKSDEIKYDSEKAIIANAKNKMALTIAHDILKEIDIDVSTTEYGRKKYKCAFKVIPQ